MVDFGNYPTFYSQEGIVTTVEGEKLQRVHYQATEWNARSCCPAAFAVGDRVRVIGRDNITLIIEPM